MPVPSRITGLDWLGERVSYPDPAVKGDTYPLTWADDGCLYASAGDPLWGASVSGLDVERLVGRPPAYRIEKRHELPDYEGWGGAGPKPSGMLCVAGVLYLAVQNLCGNKPPVCGEASQHGSDATILMSRDHGASWTPGRNAAPLFPGAAFGGPAFVNVGRDHAGAPDAFVYAVSGDQWDNGSTLRVGRVPADAIMQREAWAWVSGFRGDAPVWSDDLAQAVPVLRRNRAISLPEMVYLAGLERYLLLTWRLHADFSPDHGTDLFVYEAPRPWGPFTLVDAEALWEGREMTPYCPRLPLAWLEDDGRTGWLQCSGSWRQDGSTPYYRSHVRPFRLRVR